MATKKVTNAQIVADLTTLKQQMAELQGPVQDTLERVKQALVGTEDGQHEGLLTRMTVLERDSENFQKSIDEILETLKKGDSVMDNLKLREQSHYKDIVALKEVNKSHKHWRWLIIGAFLTGAIGLGWSWVEKKFLSDDDKKPRTENVRPK